MGRMKCAGDSQFSRMPDLNVSLRRLRRGLDDRSCRYNCKPRYPKATANCTKDSKRPSPVVSRWECLPEHQAALDDTCCDQEHIDSTKDDLDRFVLANEPTLALVALPLAVTFSGAATERKTTPLRVVEAAACAVGTAVRLFSSVCMSSC